MARAATTTPQGLPDVETGRRLFHTMALIRRFEERTEEQYTRARIGGYCHLAIGEEAATVGAIDVLEDGDCLFASYRDHGTALAVGSEPAAVMAELFGKETGVAHGRGGSMHLLDTGRRFFGGWGIVGGHLPIAVGAALALDQTGQQNAVLCQFGDGRDQHRRLPRGAQPGGRLGAADRLPGDQQPVRHGHVGRRRRRPSRSCTSAAPPTACTASGWTATTCWPCARRRAAAGRGRDDRRPSLLETITYRHRGHSVADAGKVYRTPEEISAWKRKDPITRFGALLTEHGRAQRGRHRRDLEAGRRRGQGGDRRGAGRRLPRRRQPVRARLRRSRPGASSSRGCRPARRSASGARSVHGRRDLPRGAAPRTRRGARPRTRASS